MQLKIIQLLVTLSLVFLFFTLGIVSYWLLYPYHASDYLLWQTNENKILNPRTSSTSLPIIKKGEKIVWQVDVFSVQDSITVTNRNMVSHQDNCSAITLTLDQTNYNKASTTRKYINSNYRVDNDTIPCTYYVRLTNCIQVNPINKFCFTRDTEEFIVP